MNQRENTMENRKRKRGIETSERILAEAAALFARKGYDGVPMQSIAKAAGIRESSIYNHFEGKQAILEALLIAFITQTPSLRPSDDEIDGMLLIMQPEEVFKNILFYFESRERAAFEYCHDNK